MYTAEQSRADGENLFRMFDAVRSCELPVIAHVHGHAMGGALGITACADIAFAESGTQFRFSEVRLGIVPAVISSFVLEKMDPIWARRWMMTGELFFADQAMEAGLLHYVGSAEEVIREKELVVNAILDAGPEAVKQTKRLLNFVADPAIDQPNIDHPKTEQQKNKQIEVIVKVRASREGQEGLGAFLEKREPDWRSGKVK
jgi:methylglutaconyl-CoA hydratase